MARTSASPGHDARCAIVLAESWAGGIGYTLCPGRVHGTCAIRARSGRHGTNRLDGEGTEHFPTTAKRAGGETVARRAEPSQTPYHSLLPSSAARLRRAELSGRFELLSGFRVVAHHRGTSRTRRFFLRAADRTPAHRTLLERAQVREFAAGPAPSRIAVTDSAPAHRGGRLQLRRARTSGRRRRARGSRPRCPEPAAQGARRRGDTRELGDVPVAAMRAAAPSASIVRTSPHPRRPGCGAPQNSRSSGWRRGPAGVRRRGPRPARPRPPPTPARALSAMISAVTFEQRRREVRCAQ